MKIGKMNEMPVCLCVNCGEAINAASGIGNDDTPEPGNITICSECGHLMAFADDLSLRELNDKEMLEVAGDKTILLAQEALAMVRKERDNPSPKKEKKKLPDFGPTDPFPIKEKHIKVETKTATAVMVNKTTGEERNGASAAILTIGGPKVSKEEAEIICAWLKARIIDAMDRELGSDPRYLVIDDDDGEIFPPDGSLH